jgi:hypothetical protein
VDPNLVALLVAVLSFAAVRALKSGAANRLLARHRVRRPAPGTYAFLAVGLGLLGGLALELGARESLSWDGLLRGLLGGLAAIGAREVGGAAVTKVAGPAASQRVFAGSAPACEPQSGVEAPAAPLVGTEDPTVQSSLSDHRPRRQPLDARVEERR